MNKADLIDFTTYYKKEETKNSSSQPSSPDDLSAAIQELIEQLRNANPLPQIKHRRA
jgi:hypothetical protein